MAPPFLWVYFEYAGSCNRRTDKLPAVPVAAGTQRPLGALSQDHDYFTPRIIQQRHFGESAMRQSRLTSNLTAALLESGVPSSLIPIGVWYSVI
ncbi:UNVERIFIED_CONTAM: hypothetical protein Sangu_3134300 [Sesamum angustifolium]|uniref:Uncharacterized protein n=1 Tax=Sesamum angustifolium TaxID=2727405 RepID=A0AAW2K1P9_9LAMI